MVIVVWDGIEIVFVFVFVYPTAIANQTVAVIVAEVVA